MVALPVCTGQYVLKGAVIAELADVSSLKVMQPVDRRSVTRELVAHRSSRRARSLGQGAGRASAARELKVLRELATPFGAAMLVVANSKGELEPGLRVQSADRSLDSDRDSPQAGRQAGRPARGREHDGQVIRDEYVTNVPVRVLGEPAPNECRSPALCGRPIR